MITLVLLLFVQSIYSRSSSENIFSNKIDVIYNWKQLGYDFNGHYLNSDNSSDDGFIQYNNVPNGFEIYKNKLFITVPRRSFGVPSTLNYIETSWPWYRLNKSPLLKPYPSVDQVSSFVSVYRPTIDVCDRLWLVDTGVLDIPGNRKQVKPAEIIVFDLKTDKEILRYQLKPSDLFNGTARGLTSITVDVTRTSCAHAYAYINDLIGTGGMIVFSMWDRDSWRFTHPSFNYDPTAQFQWAGLNITWTDGIFSIAISDPDWNGNRTAYYHPSISTQEFSVTTDVLKNKNSDLNLHVKHLGDRGPLSQSGTHVYYSPTRTLLFANIAQDGILCWNVDKPLNRYNVPLVAQDHRLLAYISYLKVQDRHMYLLVNQMPKFVFSSLDPKELNFYFLKIKVTDLLKNTACL